MMGRPPKPIDVTSTQRRLLETLCRRQTIARSLWQRASAVLKAADGQPIGSIGEDIQLSARTVRKWRNRWLEAAERLEAAEQANLSDDEYLAVLEEILSDKPRPGAPSKFSAEQVARIMRMACEDPADFGHSVSRWNPALLAREAARQDIVESISPAQVGRFLKRS
jgi:transposase